VTTTSAAVEIVQDSVGFINGKTSPKNGVDPTLIENVFDKEVSRGLVVNALTIKSRDMRPKLLHTKVDEELPVPGVIRGDEEEVFIEEILIDRGIFSIRGKIRNEFS
jgi:hypothetical protein